MPSLSRTSSYILAFIYSVLFCLVVLFYDDVLARTLTKNASKEFNSEGIHNAAVAKFKYAIISQTGNTYAFFQIEDVWQGDKLEKGMKVVYPLLFSEEKDKHRDAIENREVIDGNSLNLGEQFVLLGRVIPINLGKTHSTLINGQHIKILPEDFKNGKLEQLRNELE